MQGLDWINFFFDMIDLLSKPIPNIQLIA